jgi:hypothetical protein
LSLLTTSTVADGAGSADAGLGTTNRNVAPTQTANEHLNQPRERRTVVTHLPSRLPGPKPTGRH